MAFISGADSGFGSASAGFCLLAFRCGTLTVMSQQSHSLTILDFGDEFGFICKGFLMLPSCVGRSCLLSVVLLFSSQRCTLLALFFPNHLRAVLVREDEISSGLPCPKIWTIRPIAWAPAEIRPSQNDGF